LLRLVAMKRVLVSVAVAAALLVALYAGAGYWLAPGWLRDALVERAAAAGFDLEVGAVATDPFRLSVKVYDLQLATHGGQRLFHVQQGLVDLAISSLFERGWVVETLTLERAVLMGLPRIAGEKGAPEGSAPRLRVRELSIREATVALERVPRLEGLTVQAESLSTFEGDAPGSYRASATLAEGGALQSTGSVSLAPLAAHGTVALDGARLAAAWDYLPARMGDSPAGTLDASLGYRYAGGKLDLQEFRAQARLESGGRLAASGPLAVQPFSAELAMEAHALPLALVQPLLEDVAAATIESGLLSGAGRLRLGEERAGYEGTLSVADARVTDAAGNLLIAWQRLATQDLSVAFSPFALAAGEVVAEAPHGRVAIDEKGHLNYAQVLSVDGQRDAAEPRSPLEVASLRIDKGRLEFSDRSLPSPFGTTVRELSGTLAGISTAPGKAAQVRLDGRVGEYGDARIRGSVDLNAPTSLTDLRARLRNLALPDFTPYAAKFAGYRIEAGRLDAQLRYRVEEGQLVGSNELVFEKLKLGEKVESASALDLPIELAVALLADAEGRIDLAIPVSGNLNDPQFDIGGLVAKALGNVVAKVVSAPFRMIASLLGRDKNAEGLDAVRFEAGSARLSPPQEETVAAIARALAERPRLAVAIHGGYDEAADTAAIKRRRARELVAAAAGGSAPDRSEVEKLAPRIEVGRYAMQFLAQERARAVRDGLVARGVDPARVHIDSAREVEPRDEGIPTRFELLAGG
jgi:hypothetical protein